VNASFLVLKRGLLFMTGAVRSYPYNAISSRNTAITRCLETESVATRLLHTENLLQVRTHR
jgi:hypothetical protein